MGVGSFLLPSLQQGWGTSYVQTHILSAFFYDLSNSILYTIYPTRNYDVFLKVPYSIAQILSVARKQLGGSYQNPNIQDPDQVYQSQILSQICAIVLSTNDYYLSTPSGYLLSINEDSATTQFPRCILSEEGAPLLTESGEYLIVT